MKNEIVLYHLTDKGWEPLHVGDIVTIKGKHYKIIDINERGVRIAEVTEKEHLS